LRPGDPINLEVDVVAKYVEKMMRSRTPESALTVEQLVREGF
jgi:riboflavin synthase alpha subunit